MKQAERLVSTSTKDKSENLLKTIFILYSCRYGILKPFVSPLY